MTPWTRPLLVATDLDGTLLRDDGTISARTARALVAAAGAGIEVVFVTARPPRWIAPLAAAVGGHGTVICLNGAVVYDAARRRVLAEQVMPDVLVEALVGDLRAALPAIAFAAERPTGVALEAGFRSEHPVPDSAPVADRIEAVLDGATAKLLARCPGTPDDQVAVLVAAVLAGRAIVADSGASGLAEINGPGITKASTLATWSAARGLTPADVWAFGDMPNDLPMLAWAGRSFAVRNAHPAVLAAADHVCGSNEDDGVAVVLERALGLISATAAQGTAG